MLEFLHSFNFDLLQWLLIIVAVASIGANKAGVDGVSLVAVPILAAVFGGMASTGVVLPFLIMADVLAVSHYRKSIRWKYLFLLLPWCAAGIGLALFVGERISDEYFKMTIGIIVLVLLAFMILKEIQGHEIEPKHHWYLSAGAGFIGGFTTMIGNAAGPIIAIYFLSLKLSKNEYIATRAWLFWILNILKVPLHLFIWKTISIRTLTFNLVLFPAILLGALAGVLIVRKIPERPYKIFIIAATLLSAFMMFL